jgi:hypothetical protein
MNASKLTGLILIGLGLAALVYQGFTYTSQDKVLDVGPVHVTAEKTHTLPLPPIVGALALAGGLALVVLAGRKN